MKLERNELKKAWWKQGYVTFRSFACAFDKKTNIKFVENSEKKE